MPNGSRTRCSHHRLRREIIATQLANSIINRGGPQFVVRTEDQTGASAASIATAFAAVRDSYGMTALNTEIDGLDNKIGGSLQLDLYASVQRLLRDRVVWFLRNVDLTKGLAALVTHYRDGIAAVEAALDSAQTAEAVTARDSRVAELTAAGVPADLARRLASLPSLTAAPDIVLVAERTGKNIADVTATYFAAESFFQLDRITRAAREIRVSDYFDRLALDRALDSIGDAERRLTAAMTAGGTAGAAAVEAWVATAGGRRPSHPRGGARNREFGVDAVEAVGRREPARRPGPVGPDRLDQSRSMSPPDVPLRPNICGGMCSSVVLELRGLGPQFLGHGAQPAGDREVEGRPRQGDAEFRLAAKEIDVGLFHGRQCPVSGGFSVAIRREQRGNSRSVPRRFNRRK